MINKLIHFEKLTIPQAISLQKSASALIIHKTGGEFTHKFIAGVDVGIKAGVAKAAIVVMDIEFLTVVETQIAQKSLSFPYIPGLLAFREAPVILEAFGKLKIRPDVLLVDGQGLCHPRFFGLACHVGLALDIPSIGVAKSRLVGEGPLPGNEKGKWSELVYKNQVVARIIRSRSDVKPIYLSIGHKIDLPTAADIVMNAVTRYRLPEPIRAAHKAAGEIV